MKLFNNYSDSISSLLNKSYVNQTHQTKLPSYFQKGGIITESNKTLKQANNENKVLIDFDSSQLENLFGLNPYSFFDKTIGTHPDFSNIQHFEYESHYCVSMFMDIKGSTRLNGKYTLLEIRKIKDTILTLAIHVCSHFGGHVQRMQGDGVFIQFVRKNQEEKNAVINSLNAASLLTYFISNELSEIFKSNNVKPLSVRIGIDLGFADDTIWSHYGIPGCSELTTTGLHTDLAAKLQAKAKSNGILVGNNIKEILDIKPDFCEDVMKPDGAKDSYIFQNSEFKYKQYEFNWIKYLKSFNFINQINGKLEIEEPKIKLICEIVDDNGSVLNKYYQNSVALKKGTRIKYTLMENEHIYYKRSFDTIEWRAYNSGKEAKDSNQLTHDFGGSYTKEISCFTHAQYKGHHYVECVLKRQNTDNKKFTFPIFVE